ncbi:PAS domain S-box protein [Limnochorda pilosa]|uniref:histidine kinase n=1 Tax=Limnochorda pilosa TaxID=1555112 RepID=A0A0K2SQ75_LIMPI|nr:PAS domain S-box protein [Limnochorda pilosa]BAS29275.1 multi-sensor signal transduction histidine kinase [Limnochorda pilosa]
METCRGTDVPAIARYRPRFHELRFWYVQALVILIAGAHNLIELAGQGTPMGPFYFVPDSLFFVPVVYAALNFGFPGSVATALWATVISTPNFVLWHTGLERWGVIFQIFIVNAVAVFVGRRVDLETQAREHAVRAGHALRASEARYRGLFETAGEAVMVIDAAGVVREANQVAGRLFGKSSADLRGVPLSALLDEETVAHILSEERARQAVRDVVLVCAEGREVHLRPVVTTFTENGNSRVTQVILRDVTEERRQEEGLRNYAGQILRAQEEERKRIAQELHDDTIQSLILVCRELDEMEERAREGPPDLSQRLHAVREETARIADSLRGFTGDLRPPVLDDLGLTPAVRRLVADLGQRAGVEARFEVRGKARRLPPDVELTLFRIAQEALRNAERHAQASRVRVRLDFSGETTVAVAVTDDGKGFHPPAQGGSLASGQFGLLGMEERSRLLGGSLEIGSGPNKGTTVRAVVPVRAPEFSSGPRPDQA